MATLTSTTSDELKSRRLRLKRRRQLLILQKLWRSLLVCSMAGGMVWLVTRPDWVITSPDQVKIQGVEHLSEATIRDLMPLDYPQPLLEVKPKRLSQALEAQAPIAAAVVTRKLLPPSLTLEIQERQPVAIALPGNAIIATSDTRPDGVGFVDAQGIWMPHDSYSNLETTTHLPTLTVIGLSDRTRPHWPDIYTLLSQATIEIFEIDLQSPTNLILHTELGEVHLGGYSSNRLTQQLDVLAQMRTLPTHIQPSDIDYIDLQSPDAPALQLNPPTPSN
ncbi:FtsQ-type POTRA domain-containing protein [Spirulina major CS-329]|uniref:cell division protein FtsQ/DivIB n=1 Tax=Spirulina TaxID=1154 RepID=UPI00232FBC5D|nr:MULTISPECIES: FtsQ-type POTRA domain-containing protein [Spirulina]MDB9494990.1 FtsQ-type POTRA domain-containing protein [Spirulina subsalsa CS-330]MDB9505506.1 FtsQ-type POTRA domain-containing protein [Spirulina major CS-329]